MEFVLVMKMKLISFATIASRVISLNFYQGHESATLIFSLHLFTAMNTAQI